MPKEKLEYKCGHKVERDVKHVAGSRTPADDVFVKHIKDDVLCVDCRRKAGTTKRTDKAKADKTAKAEKATKAKADKAEKVKSGKAKTKAEKAAAK